MDVGGAPGVVRVAPWIGAGLDGEEPVLALVVGDQTAVAGEIGIERRVVDVAVVKIPARGVALPDLHQRVRDRSAILVEKASGHDDPLALRLALPCGPRQIVRVRPGPGGVEVGTGHLGERVGDGDRRPPRRPLDGAGVWLVQVGRLLARPRARKRRGSGSASRAAAHGAFSSRTERAIWNPVLAAGMPA